MAAIFAGASRALLTSAVFAFETTLQPLGLMPLLGGCSAAYVVSCLLMRNSIMTEKIERRGVRVPNEYHADFLDRVPEDPRFMAELSQGLVFLNSPGTEGLREAIVSPAEMAGYKFESPEIIDDMITHLASTQGALPLLQFAASKLWEKRDAAKHLLTRAAYDGISDACSSRSSEASLDFSRLCTLPLPSRIRTQKTSSLTRTPRIVLPSAVVARTTR